ncbi:MAG: AAA family ATPase [Planctomycetes bacterium]|jgi:dephospho-CoA kinase|nr:AAA family ATPase [Planctomycetota bacterium]HNZ66658.1 AAA family ATPase [Planctomycetota bacterium]HPY75791.1 AAA family ATPase [Planctomycetota bacterium]
MEEKSSKQILAIIGMPGTGKSTVIDYLVKKYNLPYFYFGGITLQEVKKRNLLPTQENEKKVRQELRATYGMSAYAQLALPTIQEYLKENSTVLLDGLYSWSEYTFLRKNLTIPIYLIPVISLRENRYKRLAVREIRPLTAEEAENRDFTEIETLEKGGPIALCDYYITNDGTKEELEQATLQMAKKFNL